MNDWTSIVGLVAVAAPASVTLLLALLLLLGVRISETLIHRLMQIGTVVGLVSLLALFIGLISTGRVEQLVNLGNWVTIPPGYHFKLAFQFDRLSIPFAALVFVLCGTVGAFASRYMHREGGFQRFFLLFSLFNTGMILTAVAGSVEVMFAGWEFVGLSSVLLIGFFQERAAPVQNGFWVWVVYRTTDTALLFAAILTHQLVGEGDFHHLLGDGAWPNETATVTSTQAFLVGSLLLVAAAGKSALLPFCGWLPRAMEGPTPSSAVFYGALSVHLGAFLLLRVSPLIAASPVLAVLVVLLGLGTSIFAGVVDRRQTDIKSVLSFASLTQVGLVVAEIGLGAWVPFFWYVALVHLLGHACLRTLQFVRAPSLLLDYRTVENALGDHLPRPAVRNQGFALWLNRLALERGYLDAALKQYFVRPVLNLFRVIHRYEEAWANWLNGTPKVEAPLSGEGLAGPSVASRLRLPHPPEQQPQQLSTKAPV